MGNEQDMMKLKENQGRKGNKDEGKGEAKRKHVSVSVKVMHVSVVHANVTWGIDRGSYPCEFELVISLREENNSGGKLFKWQGSGNLLQVENIERKRKL